MRTFDAKGKLLGDDALSPDLQSFVDEAGGAGADAGTAANPLQLPTMTVTAPAVSTFNVASLLQPPTIYYLAGALALIAFLYYQEHDA
jgi:hypothetical protein